ncbi:MAG: hypothetical protein M3P12_02365 [Gemmatimonadota bacterium]|nr:hypothetical protein [Gemmatimonadota bacterium]
MARSVRKVQRDLPVLLVPLVRRARRVRMELMAQREPQDLSDRRVSPDLRVRLARMELMARSDRRVPLAPPVLLVPRVRTGLTEQSDRKVW